MKMSDILPVWGWLLVLCIMGLAAIFIVRSTVQKQVSIQEANQNLAEKYVLSGKYPEVCGTAYEKDRIIIYLRKETSTNFPSEHEGYEVILQITGEFKAQEIP